MKYTNFKYENLQNYVCQRKGRSNQLVGNFEWLVGQVVSDEGTGAVVVIELLVGKLGGSDGGAHKLLHTNTDRKGDRRKIN